MSKTLFVSYLPVIFLLFLCVHICSSGSQNETHNQEREDEDDIGDRKEEKGIPISDLTSIEFVWLIVFFVPSVLIVLMAWWCHRCCRRYKARNEEMNDNYSLDDHVVHHISLISSTLDTLDRQVILDMEQSKLPAYESVVNEKPPSYVDAIKLIQTNCPNHQLISSNYTNYHVKISS